VTRTEPRELLIVRAYAGPLETTDGRTIVGRCVPFDVPAMVADADGVPYREIWRAGAFRRVVRGAGRVLLNYEHRDGLVDTIGPAIELEERPDGLHGTFRAMNGVPGDQALELIRSGAVTGLSVQAVVSVPHSRVLDDGTVERSLAKRLEHVALTGVPAYHDATVTAVRSAPDELGAPRIDEIRAWRDTAALRFAKNSER
jgi:HK97 family phage prohead protease